MKDCCSAKQGEITELANRQRGVLKIVFVINLSMFFIEMFYSYKAKSTSLMADGLDMLGDAFVYGVSLYAIGKGATLVNSISRIKGLIMLILGLSVLGQALYRFYHQIPPSAELMGVIGLLALVANSICAYLLLNHKSDDLNMKSIWLCSRNDVIANIGVLIAALLVGYLHSPYPDLIIGCAIAAIVLNSSYQVLKESFQN
jgi:Co/Zn/Cd efflux system component